MSTKHFSNDPERLVRDALVALTRCNPTVTVDPVNKIVFKRVEGAKLKVQLISGGGSGHEPSFGGLVGTGILDAAIAGSIFASPSAQQIYECLSARVDSRAGLLVVIMNYTGDGLHFGMAIEKAKAAGLNARMLIVGDDVGVGRSRNGRIGRRGIAGTVLVQKIAGACAAAGHPLDVVYQVAAEAATNLISVGASLSHVHVPGRDKSSDVINESDEVEIGMGIHNEEGFDRIKTDLDGLIKKMLAQLLDQNDNERAYLSITSCDSVALMVNNLGGVSPLELGALTGNVYKQLNEDYNIQPVRIFSGTYMTSLNGMGFSISLLRLADNGLGVGNQMLDLLDAPAEAVGWSSPVSVASWNATPAHVEPSRRLQEISRAKSKLEVDSDAFKRILSNGLQRIIAEEPNITAYDTLVGDGDCGAALKRGSEAVLEVMNTQSSGDVVALVSQIALTIEYNMDGTSGALYTIALNALSHGLKSEDTANPTPVTSQIWVKALVSMLAALQQYTVAKPGDRTMMDALHPFVDTMEKTLDVHDAANAAVEGMKKTYGMQPKLGRSVYVGGHAFKKCPDPGAYGLAKFLQGISQSM